MCEKGKNVRTKEEGGKKEKMKKQKGITLIALVITIIVLLILAAVSIAMLTGENGILNQANSAKNKTGEADTKESIELAFSNSKMESYFSDEERAKLMQSELEKRYGEGSVTVTATEDGFQVEIEGKGTYLVSEDGKVEKQGPIVTYSDIKVVTSSDGTGDNVEANSQTEGTSLYINFTASVEGGEVSVSPALPFEVTKNGTYTFTLTYAVEGQEYTSKKEIVVNQYALRAGLKVGDYIDYTPGASAEKTYSVETLKTYSGYTGTRYNTEDLPQDTLNWRILRINDDGSMDLISDPTSKIVAFEGSIGYNNGVYLMNDICEKLYSNTEKGITARSINLEDMEKWLTGPGEAAKEKSIKDTINGLSEGSYITKVDKENNKVTYKRNTYYPLLWKLEQENSLKESDNYYKSYDELTTTNGRETSYEQEAESLTVEPTYYSISINKDNYGDGASVLSNSSSYWVASRYVYANSTYVNFGLRYADTSVSINSMFNSNCNPISYILRLRGVVSLGSEVQVTPCVGTNSSSNKHTINW